jgi:hypothetical protein
MFVTHCTGIKPSAVALSTVICWMLLSAIMITVIWKQWFHSKDWSHLKMRYVHNFYILCVCTDFAICDTK